MLYIRFDILDNEKFDDFLRIYPILTDIHASRAFQSLEFWTNLIPAYALQYYNQLEYGEVGYDEQKMDFSMLIEYLQRNLEINYGSCKKMKNGQGHFTFMPLAYPYGGMDGLLKFLNAFDCQANEIDSGFGIKRLSWESKMEFSCHEPD